MPEEIDILIKSYGLQQKRMEGVAPLLCQWFDAVLMDIHRSVPVNRGGLLMGVPIWGRDYIERFNRYTLSTLGEERNLKALSEGGCAVVIYGFKADRPTLWELTRPFRQMGVMPVWRDLPAEMFEALSQTSEDKYGILANVQNLLACEAGHNGMGLHMLMPDHLYCAGYFERLRHLGGKYPAIVQQGCSVDVAAAAGDIEGFRQAGSDTLSIPALQLGGLVLKHMHRRTGRTIMNGLEQGQFPKSHQATWIGKNHIHMASAPQNIVWLCPELCMDAPVAFTSTMDMLPPEYIPYGESYMVGPDDGMAFCELSDPNRAPPPELDRPGDIDQSAYRHWAQVGFTEDYMEWFTRRCLIAIPEQTEFMPEERIAAQHEWIVDGVLQRHYWALKRMHRGQAPLRWPRPDDIDWLSQMRAAIAANKEAA